MLGLEDDLVTCQPQLLVLLQVPLVVVLARKGNLKAAVMVSTGSIEGVLKYET